LNMVLGGEKPPRSKNLSKKTVSVGGIPKFAKTNCDPGVLKNGCAMGKEQAWLKAGKEEPVSSSHL